MTEVNTLLRVDRRACSDLNRDRRAARLADTDEAQAVGLRGIRESMEPDTRMRIPDKDDVS